MNLAEAATPCAQRNARNWSRQVSPLPAEAMTRQGLLVSLIYAQFGDRDKAVLFLNSHHAGLGAKPLSLAAENAAGYEAVRTEVRRIGALADDSAS
jgi:Protein of unknown function (DUF2384).